MNQITINNTLVPLLDYSITERLNEGLSGNLSFLSNSASVLNDLLQPLAAAFENRALQIKIKTASYDFKTKTVQADFISALQWDLEKGSLSAAGLEAIEGKIILTQEEISGLFSVPVSFLESFYCVPSALPLDSNINLLRAICQNYGFLYRVDDFRVIVFSSADPAENVPIIERSDGVTNDKITYSGCVGTKISFASKQKFRAGHYVPAGTEEEADAEADKDRTGLNWSNLYDLTGFIEWPNTPPRQEGTEPAPLLTRELCLAAQKPFDINVTYERTPRETRIDGQPDQTQTGALPSNSMFQISAIRFSADNDAYLRIFPAFSEVLAEETTLYSRQSDNRKWDETYNLYFNLQDTEITGILTDHGTQLPLDMIFNTRFAPDEFVRLICNPQITGHSAIVPPTIRTGKAYYIGKYKDVQNGGPGAYTDQIITFQPGSFPWNFLTRTAAGSEIESYSIDDSAPSDYQGGWTNGTISGQVPKKVHIGQAKFTHDFNLYDPDDPTILYNSEVATAAESTATFNPNLSIQDTNAPGNLYYFTAAPFYYLYDTETGADLPVWNKTFTYSNYNPQTGQEETGRAHIGSIAALNAFGLYENPETTPPLFLPVIKYSLVKHKNVKSEILTEKNAAGIQKGKPYQTFMPSAINEGVYRNQITDINNASILSDSNINSGFFGLIKSVEDKKSVGSLSAGEVTEYTVTTAKDLQLGQIYTIGNTQGEVYSISSNLWYNNGEEITAALNRILRLQNLGKRQVKASFVLNLGIKTGQAFDTDYIITSVTHSAAGRLTTITAEAV